MSAAEKPPQAYQDYYAQITEPAMLRQLWKVENDLWRAATAAAHEADAMLVEQRCDTTDHCYVLHSAAAAIRQRAKEEK